jgi:hypothetical protein
VYLFCHNINTKERKVVKIFNENNEVDSYLFIYLYIYLFIYFYVMLLFVQYLV